MDLNKAKKILTENGFLVEGLDYYMKILSRCMG